MDLASLSFLLFQTAARGAGEGGSLPVLPGSWSVYLALLLSAGSAIAIPFAYGRWVEKLNGQSRRYDEKFEAQDGRIEALETDEATAATEREGFQRELTRVLDNHERLIENMGRHEKSTEQCREDTEKLGITLGAEIHNLTRTVSEMDKHLSVEIAQVQTILKERGIGQ